MLDRASAICFVGEQLDLFTDPYTSVAEAVDAVFGDEALAVDAPTARTDPKAASETAKAKGISLSESDIESILGIADDDLNVSDRKAGYQNQTETAAFKRWFGDWEANRDLDASVAEFPARLQEWLGRSGAPNTNILLDVTPVSPMLASAGIRRGMIRLGRSVYDKAWSKHGFSDKQIEALPDALRHPIAVFDSATVKGSKIVLTEMEHKGEKVMVALRVTSTEGNLSISGIRSFYERPDRQYRNWVAQGLLRAVDVKRGQYLLSRAGAAIAQVSSQPTTPASIIRLNRDDYASSKVVDADGKPLRVYHGNSMGITKFIPHRQTDVYTLDGAEIQRLDSWDVESDWSKMPEGYHYGAVSDAITIGAEKALEIRRKDAERFSPPSKDMERHIRDLERLKQGRLEKRVESRPTGDGSWFTPDLAYSFISTGSQGLTGDGAQVYPVYLSLKNPAYVNASDVESAGRSWRMEKYIKAGHDGVIFAADPANLTRRHYMGGSTQIVVFSPTQIKSAIANDGTFDSDDPSIVSASKLTWPTRKGTTKKQEDVGPQLLKGVRKAIGRGSHLAVGINEDWRSGDGSELVGKTVKSMYDMAFAAQFLRSGKAETFRIAWVKNGQIVGQSAYSSKLPGSSAIFVKDWRTFARFVDFWGARFGADSYVLLHNHPSGSAAPSEADIRVTRRATESIKLRMLGHVVIDSNEYAEITPEGNVDVKKRQFHTEDKVLKPSLPHPILGMSIEEADGFLGSQRIADIAASLYAPSGYVVLIGTDPQGRIRYAGEYPADLTEGMSDVRAAAFLSKLAKSKGSSFLFLVGSKADLAVALKGRAVRQALKANLLIDAIDYSGRGMRWQGISPDFELGRKPRGVRAREGQETSDEQSVRLVAFAKAHQSNPGTVTKGGGRKKNEFVIDAPVHPAVIRVAAANGVDLSGHTTHVVDNFSVRHIEIEHGQAGKDLGMGQVPITADDYRYIPRILASPDEVSYRGKSKTGLPLMGYLKRVNGHVFYVEEARSSGKLSLVTMWKWPATSNVPSKFRGTLSASSETLRGPEDIIRDSSLGQADLESKAKQKFGVTNDPYEAGYILSDGSMLDFSGRSEGYKHKGERVQDHREIGGLGLTPGSGTEQMHEFMNRAGAVRFSMYGRGKDAVVVVNFSVPPSAAQVDAILRHAEMTEVVLEATNPETGYPLTSAEMPAFASTKKDILREIRRLNRALTDPGSVRDDSRPYLDSVKYAKLKAKFDALWAKADTEQVKIQDFVDFWSEQSESVKPYVQAWARELRLVRQSNSLRRQACGVRRRSQPYAPSVRYTPLS